MSLAHALVALLVVAALGCKSESLPGESDSAAAGAASGTVLCAEHGVLEDLCTICNPQLAAVFKAKGDWCEEHQLPESLCPRCRGDGGSGRSGRVDLTARVRFRSPDIERSAGIQTVAVTSTPVDVRVVCEARLDYHERRIAEVRAPVPGLVREARLELGSTVKRGDTLFVLASVQVGEIQAALQGARQREAAARVHLERVTALRAENVASQRELELAQQDLDTVRAEIRSMSDGLALAGAGRAGSGGRFAVHSPLDGVIVRRAASMGALAGGDAPLAVVADPSELAVWLELTEEEAPRVRPENTFALQVEGLGDRVVSGKVDWVSPEVDVRTRLVRARGTVSNPDGQLRANQFARATLQVVSPEGGLVVPEDSVQRVGASAVVFVRAVDGAYEPRAVEVTRRNGATVQVRGNLRAGELVATQGAYLLKTELSRDSIGAGCCDVERPKKGP